MNQPKTTGKECPRCGKSHPHQFATKSQKAKYKGPTAPPGFKLIYYFCAETEKLYFGAKKVFIQDDLRFDRIT